MEADRSAASVYEHTCVKCGRVRASLDPAPATGYVCEVCSAATVDVEFMLMVDYLGKSGIWGSEARFRRATTEAAVRDEAKRTLDHARRVEVFRREVTVPWEKVEEFGG